MSASLSKGTRPVVQRNSEDVRVSLDKLRQLIEDKLHILQSTDEQQGSSGRDSIAVLSQKLTFDLQQLKRQTEQELRNINVQLFQIEGRRRRLNAELLDLQQKKKHEEQKTNCQHRISDFQFFRELQASVNERLVQSEQLLFQEEALSALRDLLTQDLQRYEDETQRLRRLTEKTLRREEPVGQTEKIMQGKNETKPEDNNMHPPESSSPPSLLSCHSSTNEDDTQQRVAYEKSGLSRSSNLHRSGSVKDLISRFSGPGRRPPSTAPATGRLSKSTENLESSVDSPFPSIMVTPPLSQRGTSQTDGPAGGGTKHNGPAANAESQPRNKMPNADSGRDSVADSGMGSESEFDPTKQPDSPSEEEEPSTPRVLPNNQNPKYQLFLNHELKTNGLSAKDADGPGFGGGSVGDSGPRPRWESTRLGLNHYRGSLESLASRDWDTMSDRLGVVDSPSRVFNSPYTTTASMDYNPMYRMSEFKAQGGISPATSEMNLFSLNSRSTSPVATPTLSTNRPRFSTYETLRRRPEVNNTVMTSHYSLRSSTLPNKKDYIEELTKQLDACQKRNQFLEAESVEMEKERNQIRFEMRGLLVNNEDLLRTNTQLNNELKRMREQMIDMDRENQSMGEKYREMEIEVKQARDMMVEANTQEYAFNFLQQSLKNQIQDTEENLEKQTLHAQSLAEKLWRAERQLEEYELDKDTKDKRTSELNSTILRLETEVSEALQASTQAMTEKNLQEKLRDDAQLRVEEMEELVLEKEQEIQKLQTLVGHLQGEVSGKLIDKEQTLEEEIQLRERIQLQCKQAERTVDDLHMELQSTNQARDDLNKQLKQAQEKMIDLEADLEELHDSEQRWASKHKRAIEQMEQLQLKLIQEKDQNEQLEMEKATMERQVRELRLEVDDLQSSRVQEDVISRSEGRVKELENTLRTEERNKVALSNTISKLERKINELTDQMEEEQRISTEQKDLMTQRIRSLKRQLNEVEEEAGRKEAQCRFAQRELAEERETSSRLQRQLLDQHLQNKRKEALSVRQTLDNLRLDLSIDDEDDDDLQPQTNVTKV